MVNFYCGNAAALPVFVLDKVKNMHYNMYNVFR